MSVDQKELAGRLSKPVDRRPMEDWFILDGLRNDSIEFLGTGFSLQLQPHRSVEVIKTPVLKEAPASRSSQFLAKTRRLLMFSFYTS